MRCAVSCAALLSAVVGAGGCCKKQTCPVLPPPKVVRVEKTCDLPPLKLPSFKRVTTVCPAEHVCFDRKNAGQLYVRLARLKDFAKMARTRCTKRPPTSRPVSQPTSQPSR